MKKMTNEECYKFISEGTRTGKIATVNKNGSPHVIPVWFVVEGEQIVFCTGVGSVKYKNMLRDPRVSLAVDEETGLYSFAKIDGTVTFLTDAENSLKWSTDIARRHMGQENADAYGERNSGPDEVVVILKPTKILALADIAGW